MYLDFDDVNEDSRDELYNWLEDEAGFEDAASFASSTLAGEQRETFDDLYGQNAEELAQGSTRYQLGQSEEEAEEAKRQSEGSSRIEYYTNSTGYEVSDVPNSKGVTLEPWALEKIEQCVSMWIASNKWKLDKEGFHRGDLVGLTVALILDGKAKQKGADFLLHVKHAARCLLSSQFVGKATEEDTLFRVTGDDSKANNFEPMDGHELSALSLGAYQALDTNVGSLSRTVSLGGSIKNGLAEDANKGTVHDSLTMMQLPPSDAGHHLTSLNSLIFDDQLELMRREGHEELAEVLRLVNSNHDRKDIAQLLGISLSTVGRKMIKALQIWKEIDERDNPKHLERECKRIADNYKRKQAIDKARKDLLDYIARKKQLRQWRVLKAMRGRRKGSCSARNAVTVLA